MLTNASIVTHLSQTGLNIRWHIPFSTWFSINKSSGEKATVLSLWKLKLSSFLLLNCTTVQIFTNGSVLRGSKDSSRISNTRSKLVSKLFIPYVRSLCAVKRFKAKKNAKLWYCFETCFWNPQEPRYFRVSEHCIINFVFSVSLSIHWFPCQLYSTGQFLISPPRDSYLATSFPPMHVSSISFANAHAY